MTKSSNLIEGRQFFFGEGQVTVQEDHGDHVLLDNGEIVDKGTFMDIAAPADNFMTPGQQAPQPKQDANFGKSNHRSSGGKNLAQGEKLDMPKEVASMIKGVQFAEDGTPILPTAQQIQSGPGSKGPHSPSTLKSTKPVKAHQYQPVIDLVDRSAKKELKAKVDFNIQVIDQALIKAIHEAYGEEALDIVIEHLYLASEEDLKKAVIDTIKRKCKIAVPANDKNEQQPEA